MPTGKPPSDVDDEGEEIPFFPKPSLACGEIEAKHAEGLGYDVGEPDIDE